MLLALFEDASIEAVLGVGLQRARGALESLDHEALGALRLGSGIDAPPLPMGAVPEKPKITDVIRQDRLRITLAAEKVLGEASKPNRRRVQVTAKQMLAEILTPQPPDPAAVRLRTLDVNTSEVRRRLDLPSEAAHETYGDPAVPFNGQPRG
jgi:hypothetical protein